MHGGPVACAREDTRALLHLGSSMLDHVRATVKNPCPDDDCLQGTAEVRMAVGGVVGGLAVSDSAVVAEGRGGGLIDLYRAVKPAELADIQATGGFRTLAGGVEGKYFTTSAEAAASYARQAVRAFNDPAYTIVRTQVPESVLRTPGISATVDRGIPAYVLPEEVLPSLRPEILDYSPVPQ